ncbi:MAG: cytochrome P450, partial [Solirubrobacterales bacterium]
MVADLVDEARARGGFPPGPSRGGVARAKLIAHEPLAVLLPLYEDYGPIFSVRLLHSRVVFMLGPEANHYVTVSHPQNFLWREGSFGDLIPLLGDGLLTIDGDFHRSSRRTMLPAFHHERIAGYRAVMEEEAARAIEGWRDGDTLDVYTWARALALRVAMRALFGFDPDAGRGATNAARDFERALSFYGEDYWLQVLRGPGTPYARLIGAR